MASRKKVEAGPVAGVDAAVDLRERRRRATRREISDAAIELFERNGVADTTVDDIAKLAGVSPRTFFRYFPYKEDAVLVVHHDFEDSIADALASVDPSVDPLAQLEATYETVLAGYENGRSEHGARLLRMWQLVVDEPSLWQAAMRLDRVRADALTARIAVATRSADGALEPRMVVEAAGLAVRVAFVTWVARLERDGSADLLRIYAESRAALRTVVH